jgi:rhodanese-related sulfurtransferase
VSRKIFSLRRRDFGQLALLVAAASLAAVLANGLRPQSLSWRAIVPAYEADFITSAELLRTPGTIMYVDTRAPGAFAAGHVAGAVNISADSGQAEFSRVFEWLSPRDFIVIYCDADDCRGNRDVAAFLMQNGYDRRRVRIFQPGWQGLRALAQIPKTER